MYGQRTNTYFDMPWRECNRLCDEANDETVPANPLLPAVLRILRESSEPIGEYALLKRLEREACWPALSAEPGLALFQKHFLLMNALYRLQASLWREQALWLTVSPLRIAIAPIAGGDADSRSPVPGDEDVLRDYYLDWRRFEQADSAQVAQLLAQFWRRFHAADGRRQALAVLGLDETCEWPAIQLQYRRLAALSHPDRGGDRSRFLEVRAAYERLREQRATPRKT